MFDLVVFAITLSTIVIARYLTETVLSRYNRAHLTDLKDLLANSGLEFGIFSVLQAAFWVFCVNSQNLTTDEAAISFTVAEIIFITIKLLTITAIRRRVDQQGE